MRFRIIFYASACAVFFWGCPPDPVEDPNPPATPQWVEKSLPEARIEQGIDADNSGQERIVLMWHPNGENDLAGYRIYRQDSEENKFKLIAIIVIIQHFGADTVFYDDNLSVYNEYAYYIIAEDLAGNESEPSDTLRYMLLNAPASYGVEDENISSPQFSWMDRAHNYYFSNEYVLRLDKGQEGGTLETVWVCRFTNVWFGWENTTPIQFSFFPAVISWAEYESGGDMVLAGNAPSNVIACIGSDTSLDPGTYRWKVKAISEVNNQTTLDRSSGESEWVYFSVE